MNTLNALSRQRFSVARSLWFRDPAASVLYINETAVRIRAGILLVIPLFMAFTLVDVAFGSRWIVTGQVINDTLDTDASGRILYMVEAVRRTYDYTVQTGVLLYALFEMLAGMSRRTSYLSPTIWLSTWLASGRRPLWQPLATKRFAWSIGVSMICLCLVYFHPEKFASALNALSRHELLPTTAQYLPRGLPLVAVALCLGFMWLEAILGICAGCQIHAALVRMGVLKDDCEACQNLDFS